LYDTIFIHAGLPKTGSSAIQDSLHALSQAGLLARVGYPCSNPHLGTGNGSALARELIFTNPAPTSTERLQECVRDILDASRGRSESLLISSEDLCYADPEKFSRLKQVLLGHARSVKLVVVVRPLKAWSYSVYLQLVKAHALAADYDADWLRRHTPDFLYYFRNLDRFDVETICLRYREKDLVRGFLERIGEDPDLVARLPDTVANRSLTVEELDVLRAINAVFGDESLCRMVSTEFVRLGQARGGARFPPHREADFRAFAGEFARELDGYSGPVLAEVREILFDEPASVPARDEPTPGQAAMGEVDLAFRALRAHFDARLDEMSLHRKLVDYAAALDRTAAAFDPVHYLLMHPDVLRAGSDPWQHFQQHGREEGRAGALKPRGSG
jgi:hypothetical protein